MLAALTIQIPVQVLWYVGIGLPVLIWLASAVSIIRNDRKAKARTKTELKFREKQEKFDKQETFESRISQEWKELYDAVKKTTWYKAREEMIKLFALNKNELPELSIELFEYFCGSVWDKSNKKEKDVERL